MSWLARLLGYRADESIRDLEVSAAAPWAQAVPAALWIGLLGLAALGVWFYLKQQTLKKPWLQYTLAVMRAALLCLILVYLAEPTLNLRVTTHPKPALWLLVDGSASMAIEDAPVEAATAATPTNPQTSVKKTRLAQVKEVFQKPGDENLLRQLAGKFELRAFTFDRPGEARPLGEMTADKETPLDPTRLAAQLTAEGQVTALGDALDDLRERYGAQRPAGVVIFSDFNKNAGLSPTETAARLGVPVYSVGVGPESALDVAVDVQAPLLMKKGEQSEVRVTVRRTGELSRDVAVRLSAHKIGSSQPPRAIGEQIVGAESDTAELPFAYTPDDVGRFEFVAEVDPQPGETIVENNTARREVNIRDDFLHLTFVDYEPNWEWRFIKEVFHRDRLVGLRGFRTFLRSADPKVRQTNELFLSSLTPPRNEFFINDVLFLGDMPATSLSTRYCEMVREFVDKFGGGLVILSGPHFGPGELASTPLADLLPVKVIPGGKLIDAGRQPFMPRLTEAAAEFDFMQLGSNPTENRNLWSRLGPLQWFQPSAGVHDQARVLLEHPTAKCSDGRTPQPLLAVRRYGKGEVVYLAINETWRLRREYGELYYRKFWGQMIHRLGLSHALGNQKRFVVATDRRQYQAGERVLATVEAYDQNYEPLNPAKLTPPLAQLSGELLPPGAGEGGAGATPLRLSPLREGTFQTEFEVQEPGEYVVRVLDPLSNEQVDASFRVTNVSAERRSAVRDVALERQLAGLRSPRFAVTGRAYDLRTVASLPSEIFVPDEVESYPERIPLWNTWAAFLLVALLMLGEWFLRKWVHLP
jgi:hypothetical protein